MLEFLRRSALVAAALLAAGGVLSLFDPPADRWGGGGAAWGQAITTWRAPSQLPRVSTFDASTALVPVSVINTSTYVTRAVTAADLLAGRLTTSDLAGHAQLAVPSVWSAGQVFGALTTGALGGAVAPRTNPAWSPGSWFGPAIVGAVDTNVATSSVLYMTTAGRWAPYSARLNTSTYPSGWSLTAIATGSAGGVVLLDGALYASPHLALGTSRVDYFAGTLAGSWIAPPPGTSNARRTVFKRLGDNVIQLLFSRDVR